MKTAAMQQRLKPWVMPSAIVLGAIFHRQLAMVGWVVPYLIFTMLFITFSRIKPTQMRFTRLVWCLLAVQMIGSVVIFLLLRPFGSSIAQAAFICVFCPTATAAPVVTGMLGGDIARVATYSIVSNLAVAILAPVLFVWMSPSEAGISFFDEFVEIALRVAPMIVFPLLAAFLLYFFARPVHDAVDKVQSASFYLWSVSLTVIMGKAVSFILDEPLSALPLMLAMAGVAALLCAVMFMVGRRIGARFGDRISAAQSIGQKNTVLAIWMSLTYLEPVSSIGPAAYIVWQNCVNSGQLYFKMKRERRAACAANN